MSGWIWLLPEVLRAAHEEQLAEHGGASGMRDEDLFESALARPQELAPYGAPNLPALAAAYAVGLATNHPFVDGNKRTAFVAVELFLALNGVELAADDAACLITMLAVASSEMSEEALADWPRRHTRPRA